MNQKSVKLIRKLEKTFGLNSDLQKKIYKGLNSLQRMVYRQDAKINLNDARNRLVTESYKK